MNTRQQDYKKYRLAGMNQYNAARAAGYSEAYSRNARPEKLVKGCLADAFEQAGLTDKAIVKHALDGLNATKIQSCNIIISKPSAESIDADKLLINKNSNDFIEVEDWNARHKYFTSICEITGRLKNRTEVNGNVQYNFFFEQMIQKAYNAPNRIKKYLNADIVKE